MKKGKVLNAFAVPIIMIMIVGCTSKEKKKLDPLEIGQATLDKLIGKETPFDKWVVWGHPETMDGTNNDYWHIYLNKANISLITDKNTQTVIYAGFGKNGGLEYLNNLK